MKTSIIFTILFTMIWCSLCSQEAFINRSWKHTNGQQHELDWSSSTTDPTKRLCVVTTTNTPNSGSNILTTRYNGDGTVAWQQSWDGSTNGDDYASAIQTSATKLYVCGASFDYNNNNYDIVVLCYFLDSGVLDWSYIYSDTAGLNDFATDITLDTQENVLLTGAREASLLNYDFCTMKLSPSGVQEWVSFYDYNSYHDVSAKITVLANGSSVVTGGSGTTWNTGVFATVKYDANGLQTGVRRTIDSNFTFDIPVDIANDDEGNVYVVGQVGTPNNGYDIKVLKMNANLDLTWTVTKDGVGLDDEAKCVDVDLEGNIYVLSNQELSNGTKQLNLTKYNASGIEQWEWLKKSPYGTGIDASMLKENQGRIYVCGTISQASGTGMLLAHLKNTGEKLWLETFGNEDGDGHDVVRNIELGETGKIFVHGSTIVNGINKSISYKFDEFENITTVLSESAFQPKRIKNELLVRFHPQYIDTSIINDVHKPFGALKEFLSQEVIDSIDVALGTSMKDEKVLKVYRRLTSNDSLSTHRDGHQIRIPSIWATLILKLPSHLNDSLARIQIESLSKYVHWADYSSITTFDNPNDNLYLSDQSSLYDSDAGINIEEAWIHEPGNSEVKIGIIDGQVYWQHEDFGGPDPINNTFVGGWDFIENDHLFLSADDTWQHGTACAGIIGARRNNDIGIAGIAGGDALNSNNGAQLFSFDCFNENEGNRARIAEAVVEASVFAPNFGYGVHIVNSSFSNQFTNSAERDGYELAWKNGVTLVCSRGNENNDVQRYPACYNERWVLSVGSSGDNGIRKDFGNGSPSYGTSYGGGMDFIAPGVFELVETTINSNEGLIGAGAFCNSTNDSKYDCFSGSSAAAPHVSGASALLLAKHAVNNGYPNGLAPDDLNMLFRKFATDIDGVYPIGYDNENGAGRLNVGETLNKIMLPEYEVLHIEGIGTRTLATTTPFMKSIGSNEVPGIAAGDY